MHVFLVVLSGKKYHRLFIPKLFIHELCNNSSIKLLFLILSVKIFPLIRQSDR